MRQYHITIDKALDLLIPNRLFSTFDFYGFDENGNEVWEATSPYPDRLERELDLCDAVISYRSV